uniref:Serpentine Receptor, class I n=1 Tax=Caenorhabditis tropicalis TaxID=1561998 RepID=A0A1I7UKX9_9PELO
MSCTVTDIHLSFLMQPLPLLPVQAGYCVGFLATFFDIWTHYLIALVIGMIVAQLETLAYCFIRKHQTIAQIVRRHEVPKNVNDVMTMFLPFFPIFGYLSFCKAGMKREEQMGYVKEKYPEYLSQFQSLPNFAIYERNFWFLLIMLFGLFAGLLCGFIFTFTTIDMFRMLRRVRRKVSATNFRRHRSTVRSLLAQFIASSLLLIPLFCFSVVIITEIQWPQTAIHLILAVFSMRSSVNSVVLIATTPPFRNFVMRKHSSNSMVIATVAISMSRNSFQ